MALLRKLIEIDKLSAAQAGRIVKRSRSAVQSKCDRSGIKLQPPPIKKAKPPKREPRKPKTVWSGGVVLEPTPEAPEIIDTPTAQLIELTRHRCKWPIGDPSESGFGFCGRRATNGRYCDAHTAISRKPSQPEDIMRAVRLFVR